MGFFCRSFTTNPSQVSNLEENPTTDDSDENIDVEQQQIQQQQKNSQEKALYVMFFCITTAFMICHAPRVIINTFEVQMSIDRDICENKLKRVYYPPAWVLILSYFEKWFLILKSSINFILYCVSSKAFRYDTYLCLNSKLR